MTERFVPLPILTGPYQSGITDPQWPVEPPDFIASDPDARERYEFERAGRIDPQNFLTVVTADLQVGTAAELSDVLKHLSIFAHVQMTREPDQNHIPILRWIPDSWRASVTIGLGANIFSSKGGDDRFGLRHQKPKCLRVMPKVDGDDFEPHETSTDLIVLISSDHPYVNVSIARALCQGNWGKTGVKERRIVVRTVDQGFSRPDRREFLRFDDGIDNLSNARDRELDRFVYVDDGCMEPPWAQNGCYLVWRKIRERLPLWEEFSTKKQEHMVGREKKSGRPLSRRTTGPSGMTPVYPDPRDEADGPLTAHIRKVQPRRKGKDLFGVPDLDRRFLRRGYPYFDGLDPKGDVSSGLLFLAFMKDLRKQFEWPVIGWQTNPNFPDENTGIDALYGKGVLSNVTGGYYFCPPAAAIERKEFIGAGIFF